MSGKKKRVPCTCPECGKRFTMQASVFRADEKRGIKLHFDKRSCYDTWVRKQREQTKAAALGVA